MTTARLTLCTLLALAGLTTCTARADALDGVLEVRSAYVNIDGGVYKLHTRIQYPDGEPIRVALDDGVTLEFEVEAVVSRERRLWFDPNIVSLTLRRELAFHTVSNKYIVREERSGEQASFTTLDQALDHLGTVDGWPIIVTPQLSDEARYRVAVRAGIRRGRLSSTLRTLLFWSDDWYRVSDWYAWTLPS